MLLCARVSSCWYKHLSSGEELVYGDGEMLLFLRFGESNYSPVAASNDGIR